MVATPKSGKDRYNVMFETFDGVKILEPKVKPSHFEDKGASHKKGSSSSDSKDKGDSSKRFAD